MQLAVASPPFVPVLFLLPPPTSCIHCGCPRWVHDLLPVAFTDYYDVVFARRHRRPRFIVAVAPGCHTHPECPGYEPWG